MITTTSTSTSTSYVKDLSEIPNLKKPQETFVDDPDSLQDVNLEELIFDLKNEIKDINNLHIYHSIFILSKCIQFIIKLQEFPDLFLKFRNQQLNKLGIKQQDNLHATNSSDSIASDVSFRSTSPPPSLPITSASFKIPSNNLKPNKLRNTDFKIDLSTVLSKSESDLDTLNSPKAISELISPSEEFESLYDDNIDDIIYDDPNYDEIEWLETPHYIPIEKLIETTDLSKSQSQTLKLSDINLDKLKDEILNHQPQNKHLLKIFNLLKTPNVTIDQFLIRIKTYSPSISTSSYLHSAFLLYKLIIYLNNIELTLNNSFRFTVASIRCSTKVIEDVYQKQSIFSNVVGVNLKDLFKIEMGFLYLINFNLIISELLLNHFLTNEFLDLCSFMKENLPDEYQEISITRK
ncbi:hypothetical protein SBY92_000124 [Candida maltosa Xu316]|uniref:Cyclin n=1 Tax=Candida maltosa (strain Xu316) TaxID=1245528 RepID=M3HIP9_CANMX|nr:hypothetical protein G210_2463 [Candida maltosa Xu316]